MRVGADQLPESNVVEAVLRVAWASAAGDFSLTDSSYSLEDIHNALIQQEAKKDEDYIRSRRPRKNSLDAANDESDDDDDDSEAANSSGNNLPPEAELFQILEVQGHDGKIEVSLCREALEVLSLSIALAAGALENLIKNKVFQNFVIDLVLHLDSSAAIRATAAAQFVLIGTF